MSGLCVHSEEARRLTGPGPSKAPLWQVYKLGFILMREVCNRGYHKEIPTAESSFCSGQSDGLAEGREARQAADRLGRRLPPEG